MRRTSLFLSVLVAGCGPGVVSELSAPAVLGSADSLQITSPLTLSDTSVLSDTTLLASITYKNVGTLPVSTSAVSIQSRPLDDSSAPIDTLTPTKDQTIVAPGGTVTIESSRTFTEDDAPGTWEAHAAIQTADGLRLASPQVYFEHRRHHHTDAGTPTPDAGTPRPDAGTPTPDAGTPTPDAGSPTPDAGSPPRDAGTPTPDAGPPPRDAGTPTPDAGTPPRDAGAPPSDAGTPARDAGTPTPDAGTPPSDAGGLIEAVNPGPSDVTFTVRADSDVHPISPLIYGVNQVTDLTTTQRGTGLVRAGGNRWTAYNWENNASNAGIDYQNENDNYLVMSSSNGNAPGEAVRMRAATAMSSGAAVLVTVPIQGYAAADKLGNGDVNQSSNYLQTRFKQVVAKKNAPLSLTPDTTDGFVYQDEFVNWLKTQYPNAFSATSPQILLTLDNEPDLWSDSHPRIQPAMATAATLISKNIEFATMVKSLIPTATITGFVSYGYYGFMALQGGYSGDFTAYYLDQMRLAGTAAGHRLIDVLDLHWYPEATGDGQRIIGTATSAGAVTARVQAPRSLWDPTYTETSWVANVEGGPIRLIPQMKARIAAHYPGTKLAFTEYSYGGGADISGAIAEADVLGIFGREDVYLANFWDLSGSANMIYAGLRAFTSYDEAGAHFGDTSVRAVTSNVASTSVYASIDAARPGRMVIVAINKTGAPLTASISLAAYGHYGSARVYRLTSASSTLQAAGSVTASTRNGFFYQMPANSISVLVPQ